MPQTNQNARNRNPNRGQQGGPDRKAKNLKDSDIVFLHIGKTAGSQITRFSKTLGTLSNTKIATASHLIDLRHIPEAKPYFFSIRNPVSRFKSGFYSRQRKGLPLKLQEWTPSEEIAFSEFEHANDLAESLFAKGDRGARAMSAITSSAHIGRHQIDWFFKRGYFLETKPPIWIIRQENFDADFELFLKKAKLDVDYEDLRAKAGYDKVHVGNYAAAPELSELAIRNLKAWYARDFVFYDACVAWMEKNA